MKDHEGEYSFTYLNCFPYFSGIILFAVIWWGSLYLFIESNVAIFFIEKISTIWIPFYMAAGLIIPSFVLLKPFAGIGKGEMNEESVNVELTHSSFLIDFKDIKKIYYISAKNINSLHIELNLTKGKVITQRKYKDESLYYFYLQLDKKYNDYIKTVTK